MAAAAAAAGISIAKAMAGYANRRGREGGGEENSIGFLGGLNKTFSRKKEEKSRGIIFWAPRRNT